MPPKKKEDYKENSSLLKKWEVVVLAVVTIRT